MSCDMWLFLYTSFEKGGASVKEFLWRARWPAATYASVLVFWSMAYWLAQYSPIFWDCVHFSVDTITLRGRLPDAADRLVQFLSDMEALLAIAIIVVWFPIVFARSGAAPASSKPAHESPGDR